MSKVYASGRERGLVSKVIVQVNGDEHLVVNFRSGFIGDIGCVGEVEDSDVVLF